ncbi:MetQ/NlpA family ABC transporter substrate-binding protein [Arthrobacter mobilis]|uniref:Metal ABC transporter substrate-binding protein n=1 Tax=Arthrobacter mobilis TaxID=2724944 RepID=A0A7X6HDJ6_9MICC|nr:MetQ/NlpA family ABC transporter substrate-binding protein [Arthrobacter mobilis]NKX54183.1 metal ABC transporter substrate-binding protein [Arthrobacter mobilis]
MTITEDKTGSSPQDHGFTVRKRRKLPWLLGAGAAVVAAGALIGTNVLGGSKSPNEIPGATLTVVTAEGNHAEQELVEFVAEEVAPKYGIKVAFKGLSDSNTLNRAVSTGEVAATVYQHKLWLAQVLEANPDFKETAATPVFRWGFGVWSAKHKSIEELPEGAVVSLYSDPANEAQGLWLLERAGLIKLKDGINKWQATQKDIVENPKNLEFKLLDFAAQSRALPDLDAAVGYTEYYVAAKVPLEQQIYAPPAPDEFAGQLTVGSDYLDTENIQNLIKAFKDPAVQDFLRTDPDVKGLLLPVDN